MTDWIWEHDPDDLLGGLPVEVLAEVNRLAVEAAVRSSRIFLERPARGGDVPVLRTENRGRLMMTYLTDIPGRRIVVVRVVWLGRRA
ncbi:hypothetical protein ACH35V_07470 [Actinomadura sp. 1N219]|uniref:hypothetical protein n=1 Tax=Actinomadura sp. 1N219 TaxID=3375152 RepID=UPI0037B413ED